MFKILGEGETSTITSPHLVPAELPVNSPATPPLKQRGNKLEPIQSHDRAMSADSPSNSPIRAYRSRAEGGAAERSKSSSHVAKVLSSSWVNQQQRFEKAEDAPALSDEVSQLRQLYLQSVKDAAENRAKLQSLTEAVHSLEQAAASMQVCCLTGLMRFAARLVD
jgi:hypothetical protein